MPCPKSGILSAPASLQACFPHPRTCKVAARCAASPAQLMRGRSRSAPPHPLAVGVGPLPPRSVRSRRSRRACARPRASSVGGALHRPNYFPHTTHPPYPALAPVRPRRAPPTGAEGRAAGPPRGLAPTAKEKTKKRRGLAWWWRRAGVPSPYTARCGGRARSHPPRPPSLTVHEIFSNCSVSSLMLPTKLSVPGNPLFLLILIILFIHESIEAKTEAYDIP